VSQHITNTRGETVEVIDQRDLNRALWTLIGFLVLVGLPAIASGAVVLAEARGDITELQEAEVDRQNLRRTMDSLLVELRAARREFSQWQDLR
jgi:hypothetical protein